jgi:hypothetical protein
MSLAFSCLIKRIVGTLFICQKQSLLHSLWSVVIFLIVSSYFTDHFPSREPRNNSWAIQESIFVHFSLLSIRDSDAIWIHHRTEHELAKLNCANEQIRSPWKVPDSTHNFIDIHTLLDSKLSRPLELREFEINSLFTCISMSSTKSHVNWKPNKPKWKTSVDDRLFQR